MLSQIEVSSVVLCLSVVIFVHVGRFMEHVEILFSMQPLVCSLWC